MTLRDQFIEQIMAHSSPSNTSPEMGSRQRASRVAQWVRQWIIREELPLETVEDAVAAVATFKRAIGAETAITHHRGDLSLEIVRCPIAKLSRVDPSLCLLTCNVLGSIAALTSRVWISVDKTWAWHDESCHLTVSPEKPDNPTAMMFPDSSARTPVPSEFWQQIGTMPSPAIFKSLADILPETPVELPLLLSSLSSWIIGRVWFEDYLGHVIGRDRSPNQSPSLSHEVYWRKSYIGRLFLQSDTLSPNQLVDIVPILARLVAMTWAETENLPLNRELKFSLLTLLLSPDSNSKTALLAQWAPLYDIRSWCSSQVLVWYRPDTPSVQRLDITERLDRHFSSPWKTLLVGWIRDALVAIAPQDISPNVYRDISSVVSGVADSHQFSPWGIGISRMTQSIDDIPLAFQEAMQSAVFAFQNRVAQPLLLGELPGLRLLPYFHQTPGFKQYCEQLLQKLRDADQVHHSDLLSTLKTYVTCNFSLKRTSATLYVHPGTVKYRLGNIEELTGWNLHDPFSLMEVMVCLVLTNEVSPFPINQ
ncbi:MAG: hypothetical protein C7B46_14210 [Sulfobacillus benefaciens]|uniref:PucR C-terminal helix-turn-helix domain-containing protein n=1 Tax=Sulfobacillus benefaciens TaxID=453960 RepID=A0A2T2XDB2_9FIRM|nr:MAG: hypothetical protein C7B46_14210 [Sulfobacillus benefaciens]